MLRSPPIRLPDTLRSVVEYRKSGLSLNHIVGCPLDCGYCIRHLFDNFDMKRPHLVMDDQSAVEELLKSQWFRKHHTPIQLLNRATDPFLPNVKDHLHNTLRLLDDRGLTNLVLAITRWRVEDSDIARMEALKNIRLTVLVTWSGISDDRIEPVDSDVAIRSLEKLRSSGIRTKRILYWRPVVGGLNDGEEYIKQARELAELADATVFTGLLHREKIRAYFRSVGVADLYGEVARRKILPRKVEERILTRFRGAPLFRKTSCGVAYAHGIPDYNGHVGVEDICDICPSEQVSRCKGVHRVPSYQRVLDLVARAGMETETPEVASGRILVSGSTEQQRYFVQHALGYQVHDKAHPHLAGRHGRAEEGW